MDNNKGYCIVPENEITAEMLSMCISSYEYCRDIARTKGILKYELPKPEILSPYRDYSYKEIIDILNTEEWYLPVEGE